MRIPLLWPMYHFLHHSIQHRLELPATDTSHGIDDIGRCIDNWATAFEDIVLKLFRAGGFLR